MIIFITIINLSTMFASKMDLNLSKELRDSQNFISDLNRILLNKTVEQKKNLYYYNICNTILTKVCNDVDNILKFHFYDLREKVLGDITLLYPSQKHNFCKTIFSILVKLEKIRKKCEWKLRDKVKITLAISDFNLYKNMIRRNLRVKLQFLKDKECKQYDENIDRKKEYEFNNEKREESKITTAKDDDSKNKKILFFFKKAEISTKKNTKKIDEENILNKVKDDDINNEKVYNVTEEKCNLTTEKEYNSKQESHYDTKKVKSSTKEHSNLTTTDSSSAEDFENNLIINIDSLSPNEKIVFSICREGLKKVLINTRIVIYGILKKNKKILFKFVDRSHVCLKSSVKHKIFQGHMKEIQIARNFMDDTIYKLKNDIIEIINSCKDEFENHFLN